MEVRTIVFLPFGRIRADARIIEVAEAILELVIDGPEAESAYSTYVNDDEPQEQPADVIEIEEDMVVERMG